MKTETILLLILCCSFVSAIPSDSEDLISFNYPTNYSTIPTVNNSDYLDGYDSDNFLFKDGSNADGNVNINGYQFWAGAGYFNSIHPTQVYLDDNEYLRLGSGDRSILGYSSAEGRLKLDRIFGGIELWTDYNLNLSNNISANYFKGDGSLLTGIATGNPFDQELNTTENVGFNQVEVNEIINLSGNLGDTEQGYFILQGVKAGAPPFFIPSAIPNFIFADDDYRISFSDTAPTSTTENSEFFIETDTGMIEATGVYTGDVDISDTTKIEFINWLVGANNYPALNPTADLGRYLFMNTSIYMMGETNTAPVYHYFANQDLSEFAYYIYEPSSDNMTMRSADGGFIMENTPVYISENEKLYFGDKEMFSDGTDLIINTTDGVLRVYNDTGYTDVHAHDFVTHSPSFSSSQDQIYDKLQEQVLVDGKVILMSDEVKEMAVADHNKPILGESCFINPFEERECSEIIIGYGTKIENGSSIPTIAEQNRILIAEQKKLIENLTKRIEVLEKK